METNMITVKVITDILLYGNIVWFVWIMSSNDAATIGLKTSSNAAEQEEVDRWKIQIKKKMKIINAEQEEMGRIKIRIKEYKN